MLEPIGEEKGEYDSEYTDDSENMNTTGDTLNNDDEDNEINEDISSNNDE